MRINEHPHGSGRVSRFARRRANRRIRHQTKDALRALDESRLPVVVSTVHAR